MHDLKTLNLLVFDSNDISTPLSLLGGGGAIAVVWDGGFDIRVCIAFVPPIRLDFELHFLGVLEQSC